MLKGSLQMAVSLSRTSTGTGHSEQVMSTQAVHFVVEAMLAALFHLDVK